MVDNTMTSIGVVCPVSAPFFGFMGVASAIVFSNLGAAYGTAKSGVGISSMGVFNPSDVMRNIIPVIMAGVLGIYGLIMSVILNSSITAPGKTSGTAGLAYGTYSAYDGYRHLAAGLTCGLSGLAAGMAIGVVGDAGVRAVGQQPRLYVPTVLVLIFSEALALYGLIVGILVGIAKSSTVCGDLAGK
eukprot:g3476.t1